MDWSFLIDDTCSCISKILGACAHVYISEIHFAVMEWLETNTKGESSSSPNAL